MGGATTDGGISVVGWGVNVCGAAVGTAAIKPVIAEVGTDTDGANAGLFIACNAVAGVGVVGRAGMEGGENAGLLAAASAFDGVIDVGRDGIVIVSGARGAAGANAMRSTLPTGAAAKADGVSGRAVGVGAVVRGVTAKVPA